MVFCNINFNIIKRTDLFQRNEKETKFIIPTNAQLIWFANTISKYLKILNENFVTFDGTVPLRIAKFKNFDFKNFEKLSGSDIIYDFCEYAKINNLRVFFLGGKEESNTRAVNVMKEKYGIQISGYSPKFENYPFSSTFIEDCYYNISKFNPDILFVGFGAPKQEFFISDSKSFFESIGIKYVIASGGSFEFVSGMIQRAPIFIQKIGLEGLYRFIKEPSFMRFSRIIQSFKFLYYVNHLPKKE